MKHSLPHFHVSIHFALLLAIGLLSPSRALPAEFTVELGADAAAAPITGRLYVFLSQREGNEPRFGPDWFSPEPFYGVDVRDFRSGENRRVDDTADAFPDKPSRLPAGTYRAQAVLDHDFYHQHHAQGVGNLYSRVQEFTVEDGSASELKLTLDQVVAVEPFPDSQWVREAVFTSKLLSDFHGREVLDRAAVVLPASYHEQPDRRYPVIYSIPGFSGSHRDGLRYAERPPTPGEGETEFISVMLSGQCKWGHHVYADSAANGPRGESLVRELVPHVDEHFRTVAAPTARFVTGHSSGGWSALWLQVAYPDVFGGVWSLSPDPVDFRDYQQVDLYASPPLSLYRDEEGNRRPLARVGDRPVLWYDSFGKMDDCLGRGGQLRSFEAVFSPLDSAGPPRRLWDRETGRIDPETAKAWEAYDIRLVLQRNWPTLGPKLSGKLHITTGSLDTFYLEGAVERLAETLKELNSDAQVAILEGETHGSLLKPELFSQIRRQMSDSFRSHHPEPAD